jgi:hypothetical protein
MTSQVVSCEQACEATGVLGLPVEILLDVIASSSVPASISFIQVPNCYSGDIVGVLTPRSPQTSKHTYGLSDTRSFWSILAHRVILLRPVPLVSIETAGKNELRDAVVVAWKLHVKWTLRRDASITRWFTVGPGAPLVPRHDLYRELLGFTLFMPDRKHLMAQVQGEEAIKLYDYANNEVVWDSHWLSQLGCLDCTVYEGRLVLIFEIAGDMELLVPYPTSSFISTD